jgi:CRISPR-associated protein Cas4
MLIPVSLLSSYLYCPRKVFLHRVLAMREPPRPELFIGSLRHTILERFGEHERSVIVGIARGTDREEIERAILETYERIMRVEIGARSDALYEFALDRDDVLEANRRTVEADARLRAGLIVSFMKAHDVEHEALYERLTPRILSEQRYSSERIGITGIVDRILVYNDEAVPFEFKTGKAPRTGLWPGHRVQLNAYLLLLATEFSVKRGVVRYLDTEDDVEVRLTPFVERELSLLVEEVRSVLEGDALPRKVEQVNKCARCGLREACYSEPIVTAAMIERFGKDAVIR